jgi:hypothetical protein
LYDLKKENLKIKKRCEMMNEEIKELQEAVENGIEVASKTFKINNFILIYLLKK